MEKQEFENSYYITGLIRKKIQKQSLSPQEEAELDTWRKQNAQNNAFYEKMQDELYLAQSVNRYLATNTEQRWEEFQIQHMQPKRRDLSFQWISVAAAILLVIGISFVIYFYQQALLPLSDTTVQSVIKDSLPQPGGNRATLTWSDGNSIALSEGHDGIIAGEHLAYEDGSVLSQVKTDYATLVTPKGGEYRITLPDGTQVWVNAASSLTYPTRFDGDERKVKLSGEAYFQVAHNKEKPFIVETDHQRLKVLGTVFNVNAYADEKQTSTTLLEGKVAVRALDDQDNSIVLRPGEQSQLVGGKLHVSPIDVQEAVAWRQGKFVFNSTDIYTVMRQIARWYDTDIVYQGDLSNVLFSGSVSRFSDIESVVKSLELTREIKLTIEGRRIIVRKR
ncbi:FecR family protein [Sphingobacterium faecale]|uniref:FecR domain-containing protein n=1 Tax=Sphingobacterium faecale TaxID=2803775 RepID=A0ABS1R1W1_9SPHI|nr:FecR domain-containing protein [Sphingobacterium faecale]MBL1408249.1 FecR domain-containing protein [Sphingobacterium faecale]